MDRLPTLLLPIKWAAIKEAAIKSKKKDEEEPRSSPVAHCLSLFVFPFFLFVCVLFFLFDFLYREKGRYLEFLFIFYTARGKKVCNFFSNA